MIEDEFLKCALTHWGISERKGNKTNLGYSSCNQVARWMKEGILPPTANKPDSQNPLQTVIDQTNRTWQRLCEANRDAGIGS